MTVGKECEGILRARIYEMQGVRYLSRNEAILSLSRRGTRAQFNLLVETARDIFNIAERDHAYKVLNLSKRNAATAHEEADGMLNLFQVRAVLVQHTRYDVLGVGFGLLFLHSIGGLSKDGGVLFGGSKVDDNFAVCKYNQTGLYYSSGLGTNHSQSPHQHELV